MQGLFLFTRLDKTKSYFIPKKEFDIIKLSNSKDGKLQLRMREPNKIGSRFLFIFT